MSAREPVGCPLCGGPPDNTTHIRRDRWTHICPVTSGRIRLWWNATHWATLPDMKIAHEHRELAPRLAPVIPLRPA